MHYSGKLIVGNDEGIREQHVWGELNKLLCEETTADRDFTFGDITYKPGGLRGPDSGDEAFHCLSGEGVFKAWPPNVPQNEPIVVPIRPGSEYYVRFDIPRTIQCTSAEPLFGVVFQCHVKRPCHAHSFSHKPGIGNEIHRHGPDTHNHLLKQDFVEAMYLVEGPGGVAVADERNMSVRECVVDEGTAVFHPLNSLHRQFNPGTSGEPNHWIHAGYYHGEGNMLAGVFDMPEFTFWHRPR